MQIGSQVFRCIYVVYQFVGRIELGAVSVCIVIVAGLWQGCKFPSQETNHHIAPRPMPSHSIVTRPKRQILMSLVMLHHEIIRLPAPFVREMLGPDQISFPVQYHRTGSLDAPTSRCEKVVHAIVASRIPLQPVDLGCCDVGFRRVRPSRIVAEGAIVDGLVVWMGRGCFAFEGGASERKNCVKPQGISR